MADLKRYITEEKLHDGQTTILNGIQFNHMANVIRQKIGDKVILINGDGFDYTAKITEIDKNKASLQILSSEENLRKTKIKLTVLCGLLKGDSSENQAVKLSELGVFEFVPFVSENCVIKADSKKAERLSRIAEESSKQCKRAIPVKISEIKNFSQALKDIKDFDLKIIAYENEKVSTLKNALKDIKDQREVAVIIGPEGGFSENEIKEAERIGCISVTLGKTILKADTAAIVAASAILYQADEWSL